jgi:DNA-binding transcriptional LysR family regulator
VQPAFEVGSWATLCGLLEAGLGITALPDLAVPMVDSRTRQVPLVEPVTSGTSHRHPSARNDGGAGFSMCSTACSRNLRTGCRGARNSAPKAFPIIHIS